jgi:hypothetical protein
LDFFKEKYKMGRPIDKLFLGATGGSPATIPVRADIGGTDFEGYIVNQKGSNKFTVSNDGNTVSGVAYLVNKITGHDAGECSIVGLNEGGEAKAIQKITAHRAVDYDGVVYTWAVADDSSESLLQLTAI